MNLTAKMFSVTSVILLVLGMALATGCDSGTPAADTPAGQEQVQNAETQSDNARSDSDDSRSADASETDTSETDTSDMGTEGGNENTDTIDEPEPEEESPVAYVRLTTSMGEIVLELAREQAPVSVANFLQYVDEGHYDGTIFHRVIPNFMIQGGGFTRDMQQKQTKDPITNEWTNGLKNARGTIAMARTAAPNTATAQFFINVVDNDRLDEPISGGAGYAVFGKVIEGMDVVDRIREVPTTTVGPHQNVPVEPVVIESAEEISADEALGA